MSAPAPPRGEPGAGGPMTGRRRTGERLVALLAAGVVALNFPLLSLLRGRGPVAGIPALYAYLFLVWVALAAGTALVLRERPPRQRDGAGPPRSADRGAPGA